MGRITLEQRLIAARPDQAEQSIFVDQVMKKIDGAVIISSVLRTTNEHHNTKGGLFMKKLRTLPVAVLVAIAIGAAALTGGVAYAVYKTVIEPLTVEQIGSVSENGKRQTTFALEGCPSYEGVSQDEITAVTSIESNISSEEARKYVIARCEQNAITKYAHDRVAASGVAHYDSSVLSTWLPVTMPAADMDTMNLDIGPRVVTNETEFYKDGKRVNRSAIAAGSLVHVAYNKRDSSIFVIMAATVDAKYYDDYGSGVSRRVPCFNNPSESCFSEQSGYTFYSARTTDTGPVPAGEERYAEAIMNGAYIQLGGVVTHIEGNAFTFRTSAGRSVTFYLPESELNRERAIEQMLPKVGVEIIITTIGSDRDSIAPSDLLSGYIPIF
jgi:hypothetical protein